MLGLTRRQGGALVAATVLAAGTVVGAAAGWLEFAAACLGLLGALGFVGVVQIRRRLSEAERATRELARAIRETTSQVAEAKREAGVAAAEVHAALAAERKAADKRQQALLAALRSGQEALGKSMREAGRNALQRERAQTREIEALAQLYREFTPRAPMPSSGPWALNPTDLLELMFRIDQARPSRVLELGSGTSSVWIAYALERYGGRLITIEHDRDYAERAESLLRLHGLESVVEVRHAPLRPLEVDGETFEWYDVEAFTGVADVGMLVIDGPPGRTGRMARYPALRVLEHVLCSSALVILDDADRPDEQEIVQRWIKHTRGVARSREILGKQAILAYSRERD